jgi:hypothetical protein
MKIYYLLLCRDFIITNNEPYYSIYKKVGSLRMDHTSLRDHVCQYTDNRYVINPSWHSTI